MHSQKLEIKLSWLEIWLDHEPNIKIIGQKKLLQRKIGGKKKSKIGSSVSVYWICMHTFFFHQHENS